MLTTMKLLKKMFYRIPSQVVSTFILFTIGYVIFRGILAIADRLPSVTTLVVVLGIGIFLGIVDSIWEIPENKK
jgi:hypothetical protein